MSQKIILSYSGKRIELDVKKTNLFSRFSGLMFHGRKTGNLLFDFGRDVNYSIHSIFVFFPFLAAWTDSKNNVLGWKIVHPFSSRVTLGKDFRRIVEIPINPKNAQIISFFRRKKGKI